MSRCFSLLLYIFLVSLFVLSGKNYFYAPETIFEADFEAEASPRFFVYYSSNDSGKFSAMRVGCGSGEIASKKLKVRLSADKIKRLLIVPYDLQDIKANGRMVGWESDIPWEKIMLTNPRLSDHEGCEINTDDIVVVSPDELKAPSGKIAENKECFPTGRQGLKDKSVIFELKNQTAFTKHFLLLNFIQVVVLSLFCAWLILFAVIAVSFEKKNKIFYFLYALLSSIALSGNFYIEPVFYVCQSASWMSYLPQFWKDYDFVHLVVAYAIYLFFCKVNTISGPEERVFNSAKILAVILSLFIIVGRLYEYNGSCELLFGFECAQSIKTAIAFAGFVALFYAMVLFVYDKLNKIAAKAYDGNRKTVLTAKILSCASSYISSLRERPFVTTLLTLLVFYIPILIFKYPCSMHPDGFMQAIQIFPGETINTVAGRKLIEFSSHHPVMHTLLIIGLLKCGLWLSNVYIGLLFYSCIQLLIVALAVSFSGYVLVRYAQLNGAYLWPIILFFIFHPVVNDFMFTVTKDVIYAAFILVYLVLLFVYMRTMQREGKARRAFLFALLALSCTGVAFFRNEGWMVMLVASIVGLFVNAKLARLFGLCAMMSIASIVFVSHLSQVLDFRPGNRAEMFSVPCQQLARALRDHDDRFTEEEKQSVREIFSGKEIADLYRSGCSDNVKAEFCDDSSGKNIHEFLSIWAKGALRCPLAYVDAFLHNHHLYFYPDEVGVELTTCSCRWTIDIGKRLGSSHGNSYMLRSESIYRGFVKIRKLIHSLPFFNLPMLGASYTWIILIFLAYAAHHGSKEAVTMLILPLCLILLPFLGPTNGDYGRYTYPLMMCLPFVCFAALRLVKDKLNQNNG